MTKSICFALAILLFAVSAVAFDFDDLQRGSSQPKSVKLPAKKDAERTYKGNIDKANQDYAQELERRRRAEEEARARQQAASQSSGGGSKAAPKADCESLYETCVKYCARLTDSDHIFGDGNNISWSSSRDKCRSLCIDTSSWCKAGNRYKSGFKFCQAKCYYQDITSECFDDCLAPFK